MDVMRGTPSATAKKKNEKKEGKVSKHETLAETALLSFSSNVLVFWMEMKVPVTRSKGRSL